MSGVVTPVLASVSVGQGNIVVNWTPIQDSTYFKAAVFLGADPVAGASSVNEGFGTIITPSPALQANQTYQVMVAQCDASGNQTSPYSLPFFLLQNPVTNITAFVNANSSILVSWTPPAVGNPSGGMVSLMQNGSSTILSVQANGNSVLLQPESPLLSADSYQVDVSAFNNSGGSTGPDNSITLLLLPSAVDAVNYSVDTNQVQAYATPPSPLPPNLGLYISLYINGVFAGMNTDSVATSASIALSASALNYANLYTITLRNGLNGTYGPETLPSIIVIAAPVLQQIDFTGPTVEVSWKNLPARYLVTGGRIGLIGDGQGLNSHEVLGDGGSITVPLTPKCSKYELQVYPAFGNSRGPRTTPVTMPSVPPVISDSSFDGNTAVISWGAVANTAGYKCSITDAFGRIVATALTSGTTAVIEVQLERDIIYQTAVWAYAKTAELTVAGPVSLPGTIISAYPALTSVKYSNGKLTVSWNAAATKAATGITGYQVGLYLNGQLMGSLTDVPGISTGTVDITVNLSAWLEYTVAVRPTCIACQGPFSQHSQIIPASVTISGIFYHQDVATVRWDRLAKYQDVTYLVTLFKDGVAQPITNANYTSANELVFKGALATANVWSSTVQPINGIIAGPASDKATFITETISPLTVKYNDATLTASWNKAIGSTVTGYIFSILLNGEKLESVFTNALTAAINYKLNPANSYTCQVQSTGAGVTGPGLPTSNLQIIAPVIKTILYQQGTLTVSWDAFAGIDITYQLLLYYDNIEVPITPQYNGSSAIATVTLDKTKNYTVKVNAVNGIITGPQCPAEAIINVAPSIGDFHYDGAKLEIVWEAVQQPAVNGYLLELSGSASEKITLNVPFNKAIIPVVFLDTQTYTLKISAVGNKTTGPYSDSLNPYMIDPGYYFGAAAPATQPRISRSTVRPVSPAAFSLYLPQLFNTPPDPLPAGLAPGGTSPFQMSLTGNKALPYMLSVALTSDAWQFGNEPVRNTLQLDYLGFIAALEGVTGGLIPGTIPFLQQLIARSLPLTFDETIYYAAGFYPAQRYVNLQAGMRLSLSYGSYQFTGPVQGNEPAALLNGFTGNGTASYVMGSYLSGPAPGSQVLDLGFSNFLSSVIQNVDPNTGGGANIVDLYNSAFRQPYFRLIYPQNFASADTKGWADSTKNVSVLSAASYTTLEQATGIVLNGGTLPDGAFLTFFRGRVSIIPEIQVFLNGKEKWVAVGTTIRNLLEEVLGNLPRAAAGNPGRGIKTVQLMRIADNIINDIHDVSTLSRLGQRNQVYISYQSITTYANGKDDFDLPLIQGDALITDKTAF